MFIGLTTQTYAAEKVVSSTRRLPSQVYGYLSIRNTDELKQKFKESLMGQLLAHPELAEVRENIQQVIQENSGEFEQESGVTLAEILSIPQGEIAIAAIQPPGKPLAPIALIDFGDKGDVVQKLLDKLGENLEDKDATRSTEDYQDSEIIMYKAENDDRPESMDLAYCIKDNVLVIGKGEDTVKSVLTRWDGEHDSTLMSNDVFRYMVKACGEEDSEALPLITWYIDPIGILKAIVSSSRQANQQMGMFMAFLPALGIDKFKGVGGSVQFGVGDYDSLSKTLFYIEQPTSGLMDVFKFPADAQTPPAWVTKEATSFSAVNWDVSKAYTAIETMADMIQGPGTLMRLLDQLSEREFQGDLHLKKDLLDLLTGKVRTVSDTPDPEKPESSRSLFALEVNNAADAEATLSKIAAVDGYPGETREFLGKTIYELPISGALAGGFGQAADEEAEDKMMGIAIVHDNLMIATDVKLLEQVMRDDPNAVKLSDTAEYKAVAKHFPEKTSIISYTKDSNIKGIYEMLRSGNTEFLTGDTFQDIDFSKLPEFETISRFLPPSGSFMVPNERGFLMQSFTAKKAE